MDNNIKAMLEKIQWEHGITEISNLFSNLGGLDIYDDAISTNQSLFFVSFLPTDDYEQYKGERTRDSFIKGTTYFKADFDVRSEVYKQTWKILNNADLMLYKNEIERWFKKDDLFKSYNAIVFSWNWFHFYWIWKPILIDKETYSNAAWELLERIKNIFKYAWLPELYPDFSCTNISRLMRLPWSINRKDDYRLPPTEVKLLYYNDEDSELVSKLQEIWEQAKIKEEQRVNNAKIMLSKKKRSFSIINNPLYESINNNIDIADLVCKYTWWKLAENWKNFISNRDGWFTWAYLIPEENIVVWKGTPHFSNHYPVYSPFSFIQVHYAYWNSRATFEKAKELYPDLESRSELLFDKLMKHGLK